MASLSWFERAALAIGIVEIPLQIDKYFVLHDQDAMLGSIGGLNLSIATLALAILYALWLGDAALHRRRMVFRPLLGIPMIGYLLVVLVSTLSAANPLLSLFEFALLFQAFSLFFFIANRVQTRDDVVFCVLVLAAALFIQSSAILAAAIIEVDDRTISLGPLALTVDAGGRHAGTMGSPNLAGSTLAMIWLLVASSLLFIKSKWSWRFVLVASAMGLFATLMTQSRGAILTLAVGSLIIGGGVYFRGWLPKWTLAIALLLATISMYPLLLVYQERIHFGDADSALSRKHLSLIALDAISESPLLGYGAGNCHLAMQKFADQAAYRAEWFYTVHCKYLLVWVETGILGFLLFLAILVTGLYQGIRVWRKRDPTLSVLGLALFAAIVGQMLHMGVDIFNSRIIVQMLWCILGLTTAIYKLSTQESCLPSPAARRLLRPYSSRAKSRVVAASQPRQVSGGLL